MPRGLGVFSKAMALVVSCLLSFVLPARAQIPGHGLSLGGISSFKASGISLSYSAVPTQASGSERKMDQVTYELRLLADMDGFLSGDIVHPGGKGQVFFMHSLLCGSLPGGGPTYSLRAGPGLCAGYVRDGDLGWGFLFGLSAEVGMQFFFSRGVSVTLSVGNDIAGHLRYSSLQDNTLTLYRKGLTRTWMPQLGISYNFDRQRYRSDVSALASSSRRPTSSKGRSIPIRFGVECGLGMPGLGTEDYVFQTTELFPVEGSVKYDEPAPTGSILGSIGFMAGEKVLLSFQAGWQGIMQGKRIYPLTLRGTYYLARKDDRQANDAYPFGASRMGDCFFVNAEGGAALAQSGLLGGGFIGKGGFGYRIDLGWNVGLEFCLGVQYTTLRPIIYDRLKGEVVPESRVWKSSGRYLSAQSWLAIRF